MTEQRDLFTHTVDSPNIPGGSHARFSGADYVPERDKRRLSGQIELIFNLVRDEKWRTLREIAQATGAPEASVSAQLRHLRKRCFGGHTVNKRHRGEPANGLYEYQLKETNGT